MLSQSNDATTASWRCAGLQPFSLAGTVVRAQELGRSRSPAAGMAKGRTDDRVEQPVVVGSNGL